MMSAMPSISPYVIPGLKFKIDGIENNDYKLEKIEEIVTPYFGDTLTELKKKNRVRTKVLCRQICMFLMRKYTNHTHKHIGERYNKDHTSVIYAVKTIKDLMETDASIKGLVRLFEKKYNDTTN